MSTAPGPGPARSGTAFSRATAVRPAGDGRFDADVDPGWEAPTGPNGGYLAALLVRALEAEVAPDGDRVLRSLTVHYLRTARTAPLELEVRVVRAGRRTASATVSGRQDGREVLLGVAAFSTRGLDPVAEWTRVPPDAGPAPARDVAEVPVEHYRRDAAAWIAPIPGTPPIVRQLRMSPRLGGMPFSGRLPTGGRGVETGGWIGSPEDQPLDAAYLAQLTDYWWPPSFEAVDRPVMAPTIDLTIHLRAELPPGGLAAAPVLGVFRSTTAQGGLVEEDAELFHPDGTLLAQSRQLALLAPVPA